MKTRGQKNVICFAMNLILALMFISGFAFAEEFRASVYTTLPDTPEGLCVDSKGNLYASLVHTGQVVKLEKDGKFEHIAWIPSKEDVGKGRVYGMDTDKEDNIYIAYTQRSKYSNLMDPFHTDCRDATVTKSGVYKIDANTREVTAVATKADGWPFCFPDDVDIDSAGNIYLTDLTYAGIWKITPDGKVTMWSNHKLLNWSGLSPLGVNVLVLDKEQKNIYAGCTGDGRVVRIPIKEDGSAGQPVIHAQHMGPIDGIEIDDEGYIYVSDIIRNEISIIPPIQHPFGMPPRLIIANIFNAPLDNNTSLVLRDGVLKLARCG
jgi:sugar lactone lactonase YvrE